MTNKNELPKPTNNGATETPTSKGTKSLIGQTGIPRPTKHGANNTIVALTKAVLDGASNGQLIQLGDKPLPAQAQSIIYELYQLGGKAKQVELLKALDEPTSSLTTTQGSQRILTFYRARLLKDKYITLA
tara:strand:+ start:440 stop:829 length:390 start_codon:yes stop_codon:yes gene_type:complete